MGPFPFWYCVYVLLLGQAKYNCWKKMIIYSFLSRFRTLSPTTKILADKMQKICMDLHLDHRHWDWVSDTATMKKPIEASHNLKIRFNREYKQQAR